MIALLQRVSRARVEAEDGAGASIGAGTLALVGFHAGDDIADCARMAERIAGFRMFEGADGRMNLSLADVDGALLLVPQFTLAADTRRGRRASLHTAAAASAARALFEELRAQCAERCARLAVGSFRARMQVHLVNDGPASFLLLAGDGAPMR